MSDKAAVCPHCGTPYAPSPAPYPYQPATGQPATGGQSKSTAVIAIAAGIIALLLIGGGAALYFFYQRQQDVISSINAETDRYNDRLSSGDDTSIANDTPQPLGLPNFNGDFRSLVTRIEKSLGRGDANVSLFSTIISMGRLNSGNNMVRYDASDGVRYQLFFDINPRSSSASLTGIAVSVDADYSSAAINECQMLEDYLTANSDFSYDSYGMYRSCRDNYVSPGYSGSRVYAYIYKSYAPSKGNAPRK